MTSHDDLPDRIKERIHLQDVIGETVQLSREGRNLVGHHPGHDSVSGTSLHVSPTKQLWWCFNCQQGGDLFSWVMLQERLTFIEAIEVLAGRAGIPVTDLTPEERQRQQARRDDQELIARIFRAAVDYYSAHLEPEWQEWCHARWGLTPETLQRFGVGFAPVAAKGLWNHLRSQGFPSQALVKSGLFVRVHGEFLDFFQGRIVIPYWKTLPDDTHPGEVTYFIGRQTELTPAADWERGKYRKLPVHDPDDDKKRYISPVVRNDRFFGEHVLSDTQGKTLLVTEGIADALAALQAGIPCLSPATISFGEADWPRLSRLCRQAAKVVIINDNEESEAGERGALKTANHLALQGIDARIGELPRPDDVGKIDIADFLKEHDHNVLIGIIESAPTLLDAYLTRIKAAPEAEQANIAQDVYSLVASLNGVVQEKAERALAKALGVGLKALRASMAGARTEPAHEGPDEHARRDEIPYVVNDGHIAVYEGLNGRLFPPKLVCDFTAQIRDELTTEDGAKIFVLHGKTILGREFTVSIPAKEFADERALKAVLTEASGADAPIYAGMAKHLAPGIQMLTPKPVNQLRCFHRTGWAGSQFLIPGREPADVVMELPRKLPYGVTSTAQLTIGLKALKALIGCMSAEQITVALTTIFQAPLARLIGWENERYALFIRGRTGSLKTSVAQVLLSIYGPQFLKDHLLMKFGQGATANAMMALATHAHDLPILWDNYKPSTGGGARELINLIHNVLEGGDKDRLDRGSRLRETKPIFCWPVITGEDVPDSDAAALARMLIIHFTWTAGSPNPKLAEAQDNADHLCAVGHAWLTWLESDAGQACAKKLAKDFVDARSAWAEQVQQYHENSVNILRVASNLASNAITWRILCQHPMIGPCLRDRTDAHAQGLKILAEGMAHNTATSLEATRYLVVLRELLVSERYILLKVTEQPTMESERTRVIGWQAEDGSAYLLPKLARAAVDSVLGPRGLGDLSEQTLHSQLDGLGALQSKQDGRFTTVQWIAGEKAARRVIHIKAEVLKESTVDKDGVV
jgi:DNA primase catalytic core